MTYLKRCVWAVAIATVAAGGVSAQQTGGTGGTGGTTGGIGGGQGGQGGGGAQSAASEVPTIGSTSGGFSNSVVQQSNIISRYYANPSYQGVGTATGTTITSPGGFGAALYGGTGTTATGGGRATAGGVGRTGGATTGGLGGMTAGGGRTATSLGGTATGLGGTGGLAGGTTGFGGATGGLGATGRAGGLGGATGGLGTTGGLGATGRTGGLGGTAGGLGGFGGTNSTAQQLSTGRSVAYTQTLKFAAPPVAAPQLQAEIQSMFTAASTLSPTAGVEATVGDGGLVVLRGKVADADEARLVEGMVRLTPGVKGVKNELVPEKP